SVQAAHVRALSFPGAALDCALLSGENQKTLESLFGNLSRVRYGIGGKILQHPQRATWLPSGYLSLHPEGPLSSRTFGSSLPEGCHARAVLLACQCRRRGNLPRRLRGSSLCPPWRGIRFLL